MLHPIFDYIYNITMGVITIALWLAILCKAFKIESKYLPFGFLEIFKTNVLIPILKGAWKAIKYLSKVLFKWLVFTIEKIWYFLVEIIKKLFELLFDPSV